MAKISGGCLCGAVRYEAGDVAAMTLVCHCDVCQRISGGAFSVNVVVPRAALALDGETRVYETTSDEGGHGRRRHFCPTCGSSLVTEMDDFPDMVIVKAGSLDDRSWVSPQHELWADSKQPWVDHGAGRGVHPTGLQS